MKNKKTAPKDATQKTRDCYDACGKAYDSCIASAGSDAEKAACGIKYDKCIANC